MIPLESRVSTSQFLTRLCELEPVGMHMELSQATRVSTLYDVLRKSSTF